MGIPILILGASGTGKSSSLRNFEAGEILILDVAGKPLPFRKKLDVIKNADYKKIGRAFQEGSYKRYVVDDSQYLLAFEMFDKVKENGYGKFTDIALKFKNMIQFVNQKMPEDRIVYFLHHTEELDNGKIKAKTVGKMLDNQLTVEGLFSIVLLATTDSGKYQFITQSDGYTTCKSPIDMFELEIDNDLKLVDDTIRNYWELKGEKENEAI